MDCSTIVDLPMHAPPQLSLSDRPPHDRSNYLPTEVVIIIKIHINTHYHVVQLIVPYKQQLWVYFTTQEELSFLASAGVHLRMKSYNRNVYT